MNLLGNPAVVGLHCGANRYFVTRDLVAFYEEALDHRCPLHQKWAPPLLFHSECYRHVGAWYLRNLVGNLHARQQWMLFAPVPLGAEIATRSTLVDRYVRRGRLYVVNETDLYLPEDGRLLVRGRTHQSFLPEDGGASRRGFVVDRSTAREKERERTRPAFPTATGPELPPVRKVVDARRCWMFSGPGRNYHTDREAARELGFPDIVVQGMMGTCFVAEVMQAHFGEAWLEGGRMDVKLTNVLWVDERVTVRARIREELPEGTRTRVVCEVWVEKDDGTRTHLGTASAPVAA